MSTTNSGILTLIVAKGDQIAPTELLIVMRSGAVITATRERNGWYLKDRNQDETQYLGGTNAYVPEDRETCGSGHLPGGWSGQGRSTSRPVTGPCSAGAHEFWRQVVEFNDQFTHKFKL